VKLPRWSLRALIILIAFLGVCMGTAAALRARLVARQVAIEAIDRKHGTYGIKISGPTWYRKLVQWLGGNEKMFYDPTRVSLGPMNYGYNSSAPIGDADIEALSEHLALFSNLKLLDLQQTGVTDRGMKSLPPMPKLELLQIEGTGVTDAWATAFQKSRPNVKIQR
jgi:hypothetical protein